MLHFLCIWEWKLIFEENKYNLSEILKIIIEESDAPNQTEKCAMTVIDLLCYQNLWNVE